MGVCVCGCVRGFLYVWMCVCWIHRCFSYTCLKRLMTFWSVVKGASTTTIHFTGTNPQGMRLHLPNAPAQEKIIVKIYYQVSMRLQVFTGSTFVEDLNRQNGKSKEQLVLDGRLSANNAAGGYTQQVVHLTDACNIGGASEDSFKCMTPSNVHGANRFDRAESMLEIVLAGHASTDFIEIKSMPVVQVSMGVSTSVADFYKIKDTFLSSLAGILGIDPTRITIVDVVAGNARRRSRVRRLLSRSLLEESTVVNFEVEPSPLIELQTTQTTVFEDAVSLQIVVERSANIHGRCGVAISVSKRPSDSAEPGINFVAYSELLFFESQEELKTITIQILSAPGYDPAALKFTVALTDAVNATLGDASAIKVIVTNVHMPAPPPPTLASTGTTTTGVMLQWYSASWHKAPLLKYNTTISWEIDCLSNGVSLPTIAVPASLLKSYLGGLSTYVPVVCRARAEGAGGWSSWSVWSADLFTLAVCGDGARQGQEECDDSNTVADDGCTMCRVDVDFACAVASGGDICSNGCRNGTKEDSEACDDGNKVAGDGCDSKCEIEAAWNCTVIPHVTLDAAVSICAVPCGDGLRVQGHEQCDDANTLDSDGCSSSCTIETGFTCSASPELASSRDVCQQCGNGIHEGNELCDDGDVSMACLLCQSIQAGWHCSGTICVPGPEELSEAPVLALAEETSMQAQWNAPQDYGSPIVVYQIELFNASSSVLFRASNFSEHEFIDSDGELTAHLGNLTASTSYRIQISACNVERCGIMSALSQATSTKRSSTSMADIGALIEEAAVAATSESGISVVQGSMQVTKAPLPPEVPEEIVENQTLISLLQAQATQFAKTLQASLFAGANDFAVGFAHASLHNISVRETNASSVVLHVQLVRKSDGSVNHEGSGDIIMVLWEAISTDEANALVSPNDQAETSGFVTFAPGDVNKTFSLKMNDNDDSNFGNLDENFRLSLTSSVYSLVSGRRDVWFTITHDDEEPSIVSITSVLEVFVGNVAQVQVVWTGWMKGALRLTFATMDKTAKRNVDFSVSTLEIYLPADVSTGALNISTIDAGRWSSVGFELHLVNVESECIAGDAAFGCSGLIETGKGITKISIAVSNSAVAVCGSCTLFISDGTLKRSGSCSSNVSPCNATLNFSGHGNAFISNISFGVFDGLFALKSLDLSNNQLLDLPMGIFEDLSALTDLDLSNNLFAQIPGGVFQRLAGSAIIMTNLYLTGNPITSVSAILANEIQADNLYISSSAMACISDFPNVSGNIHTDLTSCDISCGAGTYFIAQSQVCSPCPVGSFVGGWGAFSCVPCPPNTISLTGATSLQDCLDSDCQPGKFLKIAANVISGCHTCPNGTWSPIKGAKSVTSCTSCAPGYERHLQLSLDLDLEIRHMLPGNKCVPCALNTNLSSAGNSTHLSRSCQQCPKGKYAGAAATECTSCTNEIKAHIIGSVDLYEQFACQCDKTCKDVCTTSVCYRLQLQAGHAESMTSCSLWGGRLLDYANNSISMLQGLKLLNASSGTYFAGSTRETDDLNRQWCAVVDYTALVNSTSQGALLSMPVGGESENGRGFQALCATPLASLCVKCASNTFGASCQICNSSCPAGKFYTKCSRTFSGCSPCGIGEFSNQASTVCTFCVNGKYVNESSASSCMDCPAGKSSSWKATVCSTCAPGYYNNATGGECEECTLSRVSPIGATACTLCAAGKRSPLSGVSHECTNCKPGQFSDAASQVCSVCAVGTHSSFGFAACLPCPNGAYAPLNGLSACIHCASGKMGTPNTTGGSNETLACNDCSAGTYSSTPGAVCSSCNRGTFASSSATVCVDCSPGRHRSCHKQICIYGCT